MGKRQMLLTAVGPDRPGLVKEISSVIHDSGGNLEDSRMAVLAGDFALIVLYSGSAEAVGRVQVELAERSEALGLQVTFRQPTPPVAAHDQAQYALEVSGMDQPGIVHRVSGILAEFGINVQSLESRFSPAAFHGTEMFSLHADLQVPKGFDPDALEAELDRACADLHLIYHLAPLA